MKQVDKQAAGGKHGAKAATAVREASPSGGHARKLSKTIKAKKDPSKPVPDSLFSNPPSLLSPPMSGLRKVQDLVQADPSKQPPPPTASLPKGCACVCKCFGFFQYDEWPNLLSEEASKQLELPEFGEGDIQIVYRDRIRVFFKNEKDASTAQYAQTRNKSPEKVDNDISAKKKGGCLYSFSGLRGDAKRLYLDVAEGTEKRVALVKAPTVPEQREVIEGADLVVWACGYQTNQIPIYDVNKKELTLSQKVPNTQFDVDGKCRIMLADGNVLQKCFAFGVGFPVRTKDGGQGHKDPAQNPRADSFSLYMNTVGEMLLKSLLPKRKMTGLVSHKEVANSWLKAATYEQLLGERGRKKSELASVLDPKGNKSKSRLAQLS